ncbi:MAG TPA: agmatine deiminase family protein [Bacteroidia bacterium]|nr:agmatine deiminase family protein [Bacteroidia bacterium]
MKKNTLLLTTSLFASFILNAQQPNRGLSHEMSNQERVLMQDYQNNVFSPSAAPTKPIRSIAEFEPNEGVIVAYPWGIPMSLVKDLSNTVKVLVIGAGNGSSVQSSMQSGGVNMSNVAFINATVDSYWTRDYTGWFIVDGSNKVGIVDFKYNRPRANDDAAPSKEATYLNVPLYSMNLTQTGGNYMCDGLGIATATDLVTDENSVSVSQINQLMNDYLGISNYMIRPDALGDYIKHIDCWGKFLSVDKILIDSVPSSDPRFSHYQAAAAYYANTNCSWGYKYKVYRAFIKGSTNGEPYSNTFICNNRVFVPLQGTSNDNAAINLYKKAMPGYTISSYNALSGAAWLGTDALHCRTHEIPDRNMLYIHHMPLFGKQCSSTGYKITATAVSYGGQSLKSGYPKVLYKINNGTWDSIPMTAAGTNQYEATIPVQTNGTTVQYFVRGIDATGKLSNHPYIGVSDPHSFIADCATSVDVVKDEATYFNTYPNPNHGDFYVYVNNTHNSQKAYLKIRNALGEVVYDEAYDLRNGVSLKNINLTNASKGMYFIEFRTETETLTQKMIIQ